MGDGDDAGERTMETRYVEELMMACGPHRLSSRLGSAV